MWNLRNHMNRVGIRAIGAGPSVAACIGALALAMSGCASAQSPGGTVTAPPNTAWPVDTDPRPPKGPYLDNMPTVDGNALQSAGRTTPPAVPTGKPGVSGAPSSGGAGQN